jgi:predicted Zn-dependent protease
MPAASTSAEPAAAPMRAEWEGHYLDGRTPARRRASVRLMRGGLEITPEGAATRFWPYGELRQTQGSYAGEEVRLEWGGELPEVLLVADPAFLADLREISQTPSVRFHDPRERRRRRQLTVLAALAVVAIVAAIYLWGIPVASEIVAARVPIAWEESLGRSVVESLVKPEMRCHTDAGQRALDELVATLVAAAPPSGYTFRAQVADVKTVNAFAVPGGNIVVLRGLLEEMRSPEELAGVLAHEIQHVLRRHSTKALVQHISTGLLLTAVSGDVSGVMAYGLEGARVLGQLRYGRAAEEEADALGMQLILRAGLDPSGMIAFFEATRKEEGTGAGRPVYLSSHPGTGDRVARLTRLTQGAPPPRQPALGEAGWAALRAICAKPAETR